MLVASISGVLCMHTLLKRIKVTGGTPSSMVGVQIRFLFPFVRNKDEYKQLITFCYTVY